MHDVLVVWVAWPCRTLLTGSEWIANGVHTWHPIVVAQDIESALAHASHDAHADCNVGTIGELDTNVSNGRAKWSHRERHYIHGAALHGALVQRIHFCTHHRWFTPVVVRASVCFVGGTNECAIFNASNIARVRMCPVTVRALCFIEFLKCSRINK